MFSLIEKGFSFLHCPSIHLQQRLPCKLILFTMTDPGQSPHHCRCRTGPPVALSLHFPRTREQDPEVLELLHLGQDLLLYPEKAVHLKDDDLWIWRCWFSSQLLHTLIQIDPARGHKLIEPTGPRHLQRVETRSWCHQSGICQGWPLSPILFLTFMDRISRRSQVVEGVKSGDFSSLSLLFFTLVILAIFFKYLNMRKHR